MHPIQEVTSSAAQLKMIVFLRSDVEIYDQESVPKETEPGPQNALKNITVEMHEAKLICDHLTYFPSNKAIVCM